MSERYRLTVNGDDADLAIDGETSLLLALRNDLALRGTRQGCGEGGCGACTVLIDGAPRTACTVSVAAAAGAQIETIEAAPDDEIGRALVDEIVAHQAGQCGYCLAGIIMHAKALLRARSRPTRDDVVGALETNLCRCGAHHRMIAAIISAGARLADDGAVS